MPGQHLNDTERRLKEWWDSSTTTFVYPQLEEIEISGSPIGLRGIKHISIPFRYPLTVICGANGSGKTTLLAAAALAFHSPQNHCSNKARRFTKDGKSSYYTFSDFFFKGAKDPDITGIEITWKYKGGAIPQRSIRKEPRKWMRYETRPERPVHYFGVSRILPAVETSVLRGHFRIAKPTHKNIQLNSEYLKIFGNILGRDYTTASITKSERYSLRSCERGSTYTSFNMGAGEDTLMGLLYHLQTTPDGSLIIIEEIELGLHPEAQKRLAEQLLEIMLRKKLQIIASSHSFDFIDKVPRQSRILIRCLESTHEAHIAPAARYAMGYLSGNPMPEINIYCEDLVAERIIKQALPIELRRRATIIGIGDKIQVARQVISHIKGKCPGKALAIFDGEITKDEVLSIFNREASGVLNGKNIDSLYCILPGNLVPEKWLIHEIKNNASRMNTLKEGLRVGSVTEINTAFSTISSVEHHDILHTLCNCFGLDESEILNKLIEAACAENVALDVIASKINEVL